MIFVIQCMILRNIKKTLNKIERKDNKKKVKRNLRVACVFNCA